MKRSVAGAVLILLLGFAALAAPSVVALYHLEEGGQLLEEATKVNGAEVSTNTGQPDPTAGDIYACADDPLTDQTARNKVYQAIGQLQSGLASPLSRDRANLLLGRSYCLVGQYADAVAAYQAHTIERPHDPMGHLELGFADEALCYQKGAPAISISTLPKPAPICKDGDLQLTMRAEWREAGASGQEFLDLAGKARDAGSYEEALKWYSRAAMLQELDPSILFWWGIAAVKAGYQVPVSVGDALPVHNLDLDSTEIQGRTLQWMKQVPEYHVVYGDPLGRLSPGSDGSGVMYWQGSSIFVVLSPRDAAYQMTIRAAHSTPVIGELEVEQDGRSITRFSITNTWQELETKLDLTAGLHVIGVRYVQDVGDAILQWIRLTRISPAS